MSIKKIIKIEYPKFSQDNNSLLAKYLTPTIFEDLNNRVTKYGFKFTNAINSGVINEDSSIGVYAGDKESYTLFNSLFEPIIEEYHGFTKKNSHKSCLNLDELNAPNPDPNEEFILSTRIRVGRNLDKTPLGTAISRKQRITVESCIVDALLTLEDELEGKYYPLVGISKETQDKLIKDHFLFKEGDRFLEASGLNRNWPEGRGIYHNNNKTFLVWVNEEDHLRIISMQKGGDIKEVFTNLVKALKILETKISFSYSYHLGYITSCPTNLGTAMRASVHISLPNLSKDMEKFKKITDRYHLQIRGVDGEHSQSQNGVYDISNRRRLGITEIEAIQGMYNGIVKLIEIERSLS